MSFYAVENSKALPTKAKHVMLLSGTNFNILGGIRGLPLEVFCDLF